MFAKGNYATVWELKEWDDDQKYIDARISTSRKDKDGEYITDFSGYVRFCGDALEVAQELVEEDRIELGDVGVTSVWDKKKEKNYISFLIFSCTKAKKSSKKSKK